LTVKKEGEREVIETLSITTLSKKNIFFGDLKKIAIFALLILI